MRDVSAQVTAATLDVEPPVPAAVAGRPLRVCHVAYSFYENDNRVLRYAEALSRRGDEVDVLALRRPGQAPRGRSNDVEVYRLQRRSRGEKGPLIYLVKILWFWLKACGLLAFTGWRRRYDVIHVHNMPDFLVFAAIVPKLLGTRIILDIHDLLPEFYVGKFGIDKRSVVFRGLLLVERLSCRFADHVIIANDLWHQTVTARAVRSGKCTPILNYPDLNFFRAADVPAPRRAATFQMLYPGTLNHHQGVDLAIAAFAEVCGRMPGAEFLIYGEGPAREALHQQAALLNIADRVIIRDPVPLQAVPKLMASVHVGVVPKRADGFGNEAFSTKILEFMACGVPVIVSRTRVDTHYFDARVVRFFTPGDAADLALQMLWAFEHPRELQEMAASASQYAVHYSWQRHSAKYLQMVDALTPRRSRPVAEQPARRRTDATR
jgi:glycosyltransferase involved in cell wall biosynthesis